MFEKSKWSRLVMSHSSRPHGLYLPGSSIHGIFQARVLEWVAISFSGDIWVCANVCLVLVFIQDEFLEVEILAWKRQTWFLVWDFVYFVTSHSTKGNCCFLPLFLSDFFLSFLPRIFFGYLLHARYFDKLGRITHSKTEKRVWDLKDKKQSIKRIAVRKGVSMLSCFSGGKSKAYSKS